VGQYLAIGAIAALSVAAGLVAPGVANATVEKFDFSGSFGTGTLTGVMILDVDSSGVATSGTATITAPGLPGPETMGLVPPGPPGGAYEANDGTNLYPRMTSTPSPTSGWSSARAPAPRPGESCTAHTLSAWNLAAKPGDAPAPPFAASSQANSPTGRIMNTALPER
jgi:hypothetical protein